MSSSHPSPAELADLEGEWLGRTVRVQEGMPSLSRFAGKDGLVKAVNQNGRCLVVFDKSPDAGWYDVDPALLAAAEG